MNAEQTNNLTSKKRRGRSTLDLTGQTFGHLLVLENTGRKNGHTHWKCLCDCGKITTATTNLLRRGYTKSCGHARRTMRHYFVREYGIWAKMIQRCSNPKNPHYSNYGGRGIKVCAQWRIFDNFITDMGDSPSDKHSIERIDNNKGYSPENCVWATADVQSRNKRNNQNLTFQGQTLCAADWARKFNLVEETLRKRKRAGWCDECALTHIDMTKQNKCIHKQRRTETP
jgi:hypothetical protein